MPGLKQRLDHEVSDCPHKRLGLRGEHLAVEPQADGVGVDHRIALAASPGTFAAAGEANRQNQGFLRHLSSLSKS